MIQMWNWFSLFHALRYRTELWRFSPQDVFHFLCIQILQHCIINLQHLVSWEQYPICRTPYTHNEKSCCKQKRSCTRGLVFSVQINEAIHADIGTRTHTGWHMISQYGWLDGVRQSSPGREGLQLFWGSSSSATLCSLVLFILVCLQAREHNGGTAVSAQSKTHTYTQSVWLYEPVCLAKPHLSLIFDPLTTYNAALQLFTHTQIHKRYICTYSHSLARTAELVELPISRSLRFF